MSKLKFAYIRGPARGFIYNSRDKREYYHRGVPLATIAFVQLDTQEPMIDYTIAIRHPKDSFNRARGRQIAEARFNAGDDYVRRRLPLGTNSVQDAVLLDLRAHDGLPTGFNRRLFMKHLDVAEIVGKANHQPTFPEELVLTYRK